MCLTFPSYQVYAPISGQDRCFHRTLFVFCCKTPECYKCNDSRCMKGNHLCCLKVCHLSCLLLCDSRRDNLKAQKSLPSAQLFSTNLFNLVSVFRSQLPRRNDFYSYDPPPGLFVFPGCRLIIFFLTPLVSKVSCTNNHLMDKKGPRSPFYKLISPLPAKNFLIPHQK